MEFKKNAEVCSFGAYDIYFIKQWPEEDACKVNDYEVVVKIGLIVSGKAVQIANNCHIEVLSEVVCFWKEPQSHEQLHLQNPSNFSTIVVCWEVCLTIQYNILRH